MKKFFIGFVGVLVVVVAIFLAVVKARVPEGVSMTTVFSYLFERVVCAIPGQCELEVEGDLEMRVFTEDLIHGIPAAIDVDPHGGVWVADSNRRVAGIVDNRTEPYLLEDDLAAETVEDREAYLRKWSLEEGKHPVDWYTVEQDRLTRLTDSDGDGVADVTDVVAAEAEIVTGLGAGVMVHGTDVYWTIIPSLHVLRGVVSAERPEESVALTTGYGVRTAFRGHDMAGLVLGPDGRIYFSIGDRGYQVETPDGRVLRPPMDVGRGAVFRMQPDGSELEVFATGLRNPHDLAFDDFGNLFTVDNNSDSDDESRLVYVVEGGDSGWSMAFQSLYDEYERGPWNAEKLWHPYHPEQPAWIVPPLAFMPEGPAGLVAHPGVGLGDEYDGRFFLADYRFALPRSSIWTFGVTPKGAGYELDRLETFASNIMATDMAFTFDGELLVSEYNEGDGVRRIVSFRSRDPDVQARALETRRLFDEGFHSRSDSDLAALLPNSDRRVRIAAQHELAARGAALTLGAVAADEEQELLARLHAIWGLGQIGAPALREASWDSLAWTEGSEDEVRAQAMRVAGETGATWLEPDLLAALSDPSPRVRYFAALSLGKLESTAAIDPLFDLLAANADEDPFLRHAAVHALELIGDADAVASRLDDPSRSVRIGAVLALRRLGDARVAESLTDADPLIVVEAARAIYDAPIEAALPALAALSGNGPLPGGDDPQTGLALQRRVVAANLRLGTAEAADRLGAHAVEEANPIVARRFALAALGDLVEPPPREPVQGYWRPLERRDPRVVHAALDRWVPELIEGELGAEALEVANRHGRVPLPDEELLALVGDTGTSLDVRSMSLRALAARRAPKTAEAASRALESEDPRLRADGRDALAVVDPEAALVAVDEVPATSPLLERQRAYGTLARIESEDADRRLAAALDALVDGTLDPALGLDVLEAARSRQSPVLAAGLDAYTEALSSDDVLAPHRVALAGGDPARGLGVFDGRGDCRRCHSTDGTGGDAAPELSGVATRGDAEFLLESMIVPGARIAEGYRSVTVTLRDGRTVTGLLREESPTHITVEQPGTPETAWTERIALTDVTERIDGGTGMPPMGLVIEPRELRDLVAYLQTLK